jgi:hypothetical protein
LDVEAEMLLYRQHMYFCQFWCNIFTYRAKVSKPYVGFNLHIAFMNLIIHVILYTVYIIITCTSCVSIASKNFNSPLCFHV